MILLFVHGWSFDAQVWRPLAALLPDWQHVVWERGYFGAPDEQVPDGPCTVIAHSFGAMRMIAKPPPQCRAVVAINGFDRFTARDGAPGASPRVLDRMILRLEQDASATVAEFRARCGSADPFGTPDAARLKADLVTMRDADHAAASAAWQRPLLSLQGGADPIVPPDLRESAFSGASYRRLDTVPNGGHLLPVTESAYCAAAIERLLERLA